LAFKASATIILSLRLFAF